MPWQREMRSGLWAPFTGYEAALGLAPTEAERRYLRRRLAEL